jgi:hypothetical protein
LKDQDTDSIEKKMFFRHFSKMGILSDDPRIQEIVLRADDMPERLNK